MLFRSIAHVFAQSGFPVTIIDVSSAALDKGVATIGKNLDRQVKKGTIDAEAQAATLARISTATELAGAADCTVIIEAATENVSLKFDIFAKLDAIAPPGAILASNTSSISITQIAARTKRPADVIGMHFMNPVPVMQLVEVIRGIATSDATTERTVALAKAVGKTPCEANDFPGFIANRILMPMINEAFYCVIDRKSTRLNSSHLDLSRMPSSA